MSIRSMREKKSLSPSLFALPIALALVCVNVCAGGVVDQIESGGASSTLIVVPQVAGAVPLDDAPLGHAAFAGPKGLAQFNLDTSQESQVLSKVVILHDYADTFSPRAFDPRGVRVEQAYGNRAVYWAGAPYQIVPHPSGSGTIAQVPLGGGPAAIGVPYRLRDDLQVQMNAVQTSDYLAITIGGPDALGNPEDPSALSVRFRPTGSGVEIGVYNSVLGEIDTGLASGTKDGQWHNYAVHFDIKNRLLEIFVDENLVGGVSLRTIEAKVQATDDEGSESLEESSTCADDGPGGPSSFSQFQPNTGSINVGGNGEGSLFFDDFQVGAPFLIPLGPRIPFTSETQDTADEGFGGSGGGGGGGGGSPSNRPTDIPTDGPPIDPPPPETPPIPAPAAFPAGLALLAGWAALRRKRP